MFDKPTDNNTIGLMQEGSLIKGVKISLEKREPVLVNVFHCTVEDLQKQDFVSEKFLVVTAINGEETLTRALDLKIKKDKDIDAVLSFQAEPLLPYPVENAILDRITLSKSSEGVHLTVFAVRIDHMQNHLSQWNNLGIDPEVVICEQIALGSFSKYFCSSDQFHFIVHLGKFQTICVLVKEGKVYSSQSAHFGMNDFEQSEEKEQSIHHWKLEIARLQHAIIKQRKGFEISEILFTGEGADFENIVQTCLKGSNQVLLQLKERLSFSIEPKELLSLAIPIGNALSCLSDVESPINFRQKELSYANPWKRLKSSLVTYFGGCLLLISAIYLFGIAFVNYQESQLRQEYIDLLASRNRSYENFERDFSLKHLKLQDVNIPNMETLSHQQIGARLAYIQKEIKGTPDIFPLLPNIPRVSDLFAWLSMHPIFSNKENAIVLENLSYAMVKFPEVKKPTEKYQVKVEIEFSTPTPKVAREFHDALIAPNDIVDGKGEVKWSSNKGKYKASFYLKDKTIYQPVRSL